MIDPERISWGITAARSRRSRRTPVQDNIRFSALVFPIWVLFKARHHAHPIPGREFYPWATPLEYTVIGLSWGAIAVVFLPILWLGLGRSLREQTPAGAEWSNRRRTLRQLVENAFVWLLAIIPSFILPLVLTGDTTKTCPPILSHRLQWCAIARPHLVGLCLFGAVAAGVRRIKGPTYGCLRSASCTCSPASS